MSRQLDLVVQGVVGTNPTLGYTPKNNRAFCRFRVAVTPSHREGDTWVDEDTMWLTAKAWGSLARHLAYSLRKGEPVLLVGRLSEERWTGPKGPGQTNVLTVQCGGHDLTRGETRFVRVTDAGSAGSSASPAASASPDRAGAGQATVAEQAPGTGAGTEPGTGSIADAPAAGTGEQETGEAQAPETAPEDPWAVSPPDEDVSDGAYRGGPTAPDEALPGAGPGLPEPAGYVLEGEEIAGPTEVLIA